MLLIIFFYVANKFIWSILFWKLLILAIDVVLQTSDKNNKTYQEEVIILI